MQYHFTEKAAKSTVFIADVWLFVSRENDLNRFESKVYSGSSAMGGQPMLSPQSIVDALSQLDTTMQKLEHAVMDIIKDIEQKKKVW